MPVFDSRQVHDFSILQSVHTAPGAHTASYPIGTGAKRSGREADHSPPSSPEDTNSGAISPLYHTSSWRGV
jgi:hypothetical protein